MKYIKFIRIFLLVLIIIGVGLLLSQNFWVPMLVNQILLWQGAPIVTPVTVQVMPDGSIGTIFSGNLSCKDSPNYFIISKSLTDSVGSDILVKNKTSQSQSMSCVYTVGQNDFEIKNVEAEYFLAVTGHFLILDKGTAPYPRGLIVYDLNTHKKVYTDKYSAPLVVSSSTVRYWNPTVTKPNNVNCPKLSEYSAGGLGAEIEQFVTLDLSTIIKKDSGQSRCSATQ
ncbi:MAG: hypothetical protein WCK48_01110 [bacterium]